MAYDVLLISMGIWAVPPGWGENAGFTSLLGELTFIQIQQILKSHNKYIEI